MLFVDYTFDVFDDGTIIMDSELTKEKLNVKQDDKYVVDITFDGRIIFRKVKE